MHCDMLNTLRPTALADWKVDDHLLNPRSHDLDLSPYKTICFSGWENFDEHALGDRLADFVEDGGRVLIYPPANCTANLTLKGRFQRYMAFTSGEFQDPKYRTLGFVYNTPWKDAFAGMERTSFIGHINGRIKMRVQNATCFKVASLKDGSPFAAVVQCKKGWVMHINTCPIGNPMGETIIIAGLRFLMNFDQPPKLTTVVSSEIRAVKVQFGDDNFTVTDSHVLATCGETMKNLLEGDREADVYPINLPYKDNFDLLAYYFKTGTINQSMIDPSKFVSLIHCADYLQSDYLQAEIKSYFSIIKNARVVSKKDEKFNSMHLPFRTLQVLIPGLADLVASPGFHTSPWCRIFRRYILATED